MNYHDQIMNIQLTSAKIGAAVEAGVLLDNDRETKLALACKMGHRYARHDAAEIAARVDAKIERLMISLEKAAKDFVSANGTTPEWWIAVMDIYGGKSALADSALKGTEEETK